MERRCARYGAVHAMQGDDEVTTKCAVWITSSTTGSAGGGGDGAEDEDRAEPSIGIGKVEDKQFDPVTFNVLMVSAENIASQLTLGDLPVFKAIRPEELTSCAWNGRNKMQVAPNVVAFIRRFNHVCLWCQKEVLNCESLKRRVEVLGHFIKIAKKLIELNNIHSAFAIISGLRSNALYRLRRTWTALPSKDKMTYERMEKLFSDRNNWERLRKYMQAVKLPCIPYLGLYLTDLVYIDVAHPSSGGLESSQRTNLMNNILRVLADLQSSVYENLLSIDYFQQYLDTIRYIDELQKFVEEDLYSLSMKLEPPGQPGHSFDKRVERLTSATEGGLKSLSLTPQANKPKQGHRKTQSLGGSHVPPRLDRSLVSDVFSMTVDARRHLLDDSLLEFSSCTDGIGDSGNESSDEVIAADSSNKTDGRFSRSVNALDDDKCIMEGAVRRKTVLKWGRRPRVMAPIKWQALNYKAHAGKMLSLCGWMVVKGDDPFMPDTFLLQEPAQGSHVYRFRAGNQALALQWVECLKKACEDPRKKPPSNLMTFD